jgi:hypothetical protein
MAGPSDALPDPWLPNEILPWVHLNDAKCFPPRTKWCKRNRGNFIARIQCIVLIPSRCQKTQLSLQPHCVPECVRNGENEMHEPYFRASLSQNNSLFPAGAHPWPISRVRDGRPQGISSTLNDFKIHIFNLN